ncbi:MAG: YlbF family regulator [Eubacterium sp.]|nr:YlbF family regulator [Eubacterium sp.]
MQSEKKEPGLLPEADQVVRRTQDLTAFIKETEDYRRYKKSLKVLKEHQETYQKFNEFRRKNLYLDEQEEAYFEKADALYDEYKDILMESCVMDFLRSEETVNTMLRRVYDCLAGEIQIDVSYMD